MPVARQLCAAEALQEWQLAGPRVDMQTPFDAFPEPIFLKPVGPIWPWGLRRIRLRIRQEI